ncbi:MAG TPA: hypothetical protein VM261_24315 [Kofleriaceae bacterium]|nr:hypothetical protein [Kofleriaceae bacterium]
MSKTARFYGSSDDPTCGGGTCGDGYLRRASVYIDKWGSHNLGGYGLTGEDSVPGDSGGGLIYETTAGRELAGVLKGRFHDMIIQPDAFRQWALSTVYDRPVDLLDIWDFPPSSNHFFAVPLQDSFDATHRARARSPAT